MNSRSNSTTKQIIRLWRLLGRTLSPLASRTVAQISGRDGAKALRMPPKVSITLIATTIILVSLLVRRKGCQCRRLLKNMC